MFIIFIIQVKETECTLFQTKLHTLFESNNLVYKFFFKSACYIVSSDKISLHILSILGSFTWTMLGKNVYKSTYSEQNNITLMYDCKEFKKKKYLQKRIKKQVHIPRYTASMYLIRHNYNFKFSLFKRLFIVERQPHTLYIDSNTQMEGLQFYFYQIFKCNK